jgi:hypothetical protein
MLFSPSRTAFSAVARDGIPSSQGAPNRMKVNAATRFSQ